MAMTLDVDSRFSNKNPSQREKHMLPNKTRLQVRRVTPCDHQTQTVRPPTAAMSRVHQSGMGRLAFVVICVSFSKGQLDSNSFSEQSIHSERIVGHSDITRNGATSEHGAIAQKYSQDFKEYTR